MEVHVVMADYYHEGAESICAFMQKNAADSFMRKCERHHAKRPQYPSHDCSDKEWETAEKKKEKWRKSHPAGAENEDCDSFRVESIPLK